MSGATVTGNGKIALILDLPGLIQSYAHLHWLGREPVSSP